jgi:hypothetical protein
MNKKTKIKNGNNGFVLFFSLIISTIVLSIISGIILIAYKELIISSTERESQKAFYSADTGAECALYWDIKHPLPGFEDISIFPNSSDSTLPGTITNGCSQNNINITSILVPAPTLTSATSTFSMDISSSGVCVDVIVSKYVDSLGNEKTKIDSHGYNTCDTASNRRVERGIRITY